MSEEHTQEPSTTDIQAGGAGPRGRESSASGLSPAGRAVRITITLVITGLVVATTLWGADDFFPFAPFKMYSHSRDLDGWAGSTRVMAVNEAGEEFALTEAATGFRRAEVEGQMSRFRDDPEMLRHLAEAYQSTNPDKPEIVAVRIVVRRYRLENGYRTGEYTDTVEVSWTREGAAA
ncbi:hypothetical protein [Glycomyces xiaoerkulensis]|uniref:hypothetical protein n=1 Tax=Glycomyces xiaoerkulensis TaxID=2038139 RepID=UPI000C26B42D|nr:hypothetical protein [Glycomyces xiaoerkulensis]